MNLSITTFIKLALSLLLVLLSSNALAQLQPDQPTDAPPVFSKSISEVINGPFETTIEFSQTEDQFTVVEIGGYGVNTYETLGDIELKEEQWSTFILGNYPRKFYLIDTDYCLDCTLKVITIETNTQNKLVEVNLKTYDKDYNNDRYQFEKALKKISPTIAKEQKIQILKKLLTISKKLGEMVKHEELKQALSQQFTELTPEKKESLLSIELPKSHPDYVINLAEAYFNIGLINLRAENLDHAEKNIRKSIELLKKSKSSSIKETHLTNWLLSDAINSLGVTLSENSSSIELANQAFDQAYWYSEESNNNLVKELVLNNKGWFSRTQNNTEEAANYHHSAFEYLTDPKTHMGMTQYRLNEKLMRTQYHMAIVSAIRGRYYHALKLIERAEQIAISDMSNFLWQAHIKAAKGRMLMELGQYNESQNEYKIAWDLYEKLGNKFQLSVISINLVKLYTKLGNHELALEYLNNSFDTLDKNSEYRIKALSTEAESYLANKNYEKAIAVLQKLLSSITLSKDILLEGRTLTRLSEAQIGIGNYQSAIDNLKKAINITRDNNDDLHFTKSNYLAALALSHSDKHTEVGTALSHLKIAKNTIENIRSTLVDDGIRQQYFSLQKSIYELEIHLHMRNQADPEAKILGLLSAESFRARTLYESITQEKPKPTDVTRKNSIIEGSSLEISSSLLESTFQELENNQNYQIENVLTKDNFYELTKNLDDKTAILYFFTGNSQSYSWLVTKNKVLSSRIETSESLAIIVSDYMNSASISPSGKLPLKIWKHLHKTGNEISKLILSDYKKELVDYKNIVIAPDGPLHRIPFSALPLNDSKKLLIDQHTVTYISSIATYNVLSQSNTNVKLKRPLLLISNPDILSDGILGTRLPSAKIEASEISKLWADIGDITWLKGDNANKKNLTNLDLNSYDTLHFATHALANWDYPGQSFIALSNKNTPQKLDNNLTQLEISNWDISAELVVLSACDTALGKHIEGEGPLGLSRAFIEAGANRVIASLWPIDDNASAELMKNFYYNLHIKEQSPAEALTNAQRKLKSIGKWSHPYYWSGFNFTGNRNPWK